MTLERCCEIISVAALLFLVLSRFDNDDDVIINQCGNKSTFRMECQLDNCVWSAANVHNTDYFLSNHTYGLQFHSPFPWMLSIVVVCHHPQLHIKSTMDSVMTSTSTLPKSAHERLLVDDASTCLTHEVRQHAHLLGFRVHRISISMGLARVMNYAALHLVRGSHMLFLTAFDRLAPCYLALASPLIGKWDVIYGNYWIINRRRKRLLRPTTNMTVTDCMRSGIFPTSFIIHRQVYLHHGGVAASMVYGRADHAFWITLLRNNVTRYHINTEASYIQMTEASMSSDVDDHDRADAMLILSHPSLFSNTRVCNAIRRLSSSRHTERSLEQVLKSPDQDCPAWVFLAIHKRRARCREEMKTFRAQALETCMHRIKFWHASNDTILLLNYVMQSLSHGRCISELYSYANMSVEPAVAYHWYTADEGEPSMVATCPPTAPLVSKPQPERVIPKIIHFIYGLLPNPQFKFMHQVAILSAKRVYRDYRIWFHCSYQPYGEHWDSIKDIVEVMHVDPHSNVYDGRCFQHHAHEADYIRLRLLHDHGGIYFDIDSLTLRALPAQYLKSGRFLLAWQNTPKKYGLCNAMMASPPMNMFAAEWLRHYRSFASVGVSNTWDFHSVKLPGKLAGCPGLSSHVLALPDATFFPFYWKDAHRLLVSKRSHSIADLFLVERDRTPDLTASYTMHLWTSGNNQAYANLINNHSLDDICLETHLYAQLVCSMLQQSEPLPNVVPTWEDTFTALGPRQ